MKLIKPVVVTDSILVSTTVPENDYAAWSSGTTYAIGNRVIVVSVHKVYESLINANLNNNPVTDDGTKWLEVGATNRWKAFDKKIGDPVVQVTSAQYVLSDPDSNVTAVALFGLQGISANVTVTDAVDGQIYNETISLIDNGNVIDWFTYFFEGQALLEEALFLNIPPYFGSDVQITVTNATGENVNIGQIVFGFLSELGLTTYGTSISIEDYSRKETDTFGNFIIVERAFAQLVDYNVSYPTQNSRKIQSTLAKYRATPIVYIGSEDTAYGTVVYGFYRRFDLTLETPSYSLGAIEVEGLT